jgi:hypothetical protein
MPHPCFYEGDDGKEYVRIPVPKASTKEEQEFIEVCTTDLSADMLGEAIYAGIKGIINRGMPAKDSSASGRKAAMKKAEDNLQKLQEGKVRVTGGKIKTAKGDGEAVKLAMVEAKALVKDSIKRQGKVKVSLVSAATITAYAKEYLASEAGKALIDKAKAMIAARNAAAEAEEAAPIDLSGLRADPKLVAANEKRKTERKKAKADAEVGVAELMREEGPRARR